MLYRRFILNLFLRQTSEKVQQKKHCQQLIFALTKKLSSFGRQQNKCEAFNKNFCMAKKQH